MSAFSACAIPPPTPEQRRAAAGQFERANQVIATGDYDYGIQLLLGCCKLDPANLIYRQLLRRTQKARFKKNRRPAWLTWLTALAAKLRLKWAMAFGAREPLRVLEYGELVLARNPYDLATLLDMARAAEELGAAEMALWTLEQARKRAPRDTAVARALARLHEQGGNFSQALAAWDLLHRLDPSDEEAARKVKELPARDTIERGNYQETLSGEATARFGPAEEEADSTPPPLEEPAVRLPLNTDPVAVPLMMRLQADPTDWQAYLQLAAVYRRNGRLEQARQVLQEGLGPTCNRFELLVELGDLEIEPFRRNLALTEEKLKADPNDAELRTIRVRLLKEINTRELELFRQKADRQPAELAHRFELGLRLLRAGQTDAAIKELQLARADMRLKWRALLYLGHCFKARNNWRLAQRNFQDALESLPASEVAARKEILFQLAQGAAEAGDLATAVEMGLELAHLDFGYRDINRLLDEWQGRVQDADVPQ
jgi:Flp pilus assembly protein TadD